MIKAMPPDALHEERLSEGVGGGGGHGQVVTVEGLCSGMRTDCWWNPLPNRLR